MAPEIACLNRPYAWSPNSDKHLISPYKITTWSSIQVTKKYTDKYLKNSEENKPVDIGAKRAN